MRLVKFVAIIALGLVLIPFSADAQRWGKKKTITGQGNVVKKTLDISGFTKVGVSLNATVYLTQGSSYKVEIEAQQNIIDELNKEVKKEGWNIGFEDNVNAKNYKKATVWITMPSVTGLAIAGSGDIVGKTAFNNLGEVKLSIAGSGDIEFSGDAEHAKLSIAGSGKIKADDFEVSSAKVSIAGSGSTYIHVTGGEMNVSIAGSGDVYYKGSAKIKTSIAGSGNVRSID